jgi:thioredoxin reductase
MERLGVDVTADSVTKVCYKKTGFQVKTIQSDYEPRFLIVASGTAPNPFPVPVPHAAQARVFGDVYHLLAESNKKVIIIGAGDAAFDYALNLTKNRNSVTILNHGREVKCLGLLWERARDEPQIDYRAESAIFKVEFDETDGRLRIRTEANGCLIADYLLFATGRVPQASFLPDELINNNLESLYLAGDVKNGLYRQAAIAAGDGLRAAMEIHHKLNSEA